MELVEYFAASSIRMAAPLLLAALGLSISERSGLMNIGGEGVMLVGAFIAYTVSVLTGSYWLGMFCALPAALAVMLIFAFSSITLRVHQVVVGMGINMFSLGITSFLLRRFFRGDDSIAAGLIAPSFPSVPIPLLSRIPFLGSLLFNHNVIVYFSFLMVFVLWFILKRTSLGLKIISVGESPRTADGLGINVIRVRYLSTLFSGLMLGIAGAYLSIAQSNIFTENMTGGRGYIAMAVVVLGKWSPLGVLAGAILFGATSSLQLIIQNQGYAISSHLVMTFPYFCTILAVIAMSRNKVAAPSNLAIPYAKS